MFDDVLQAFLRDAVQRDLDVVGQPRIGEIAPSISTCRIERARLASPPASPRSSSTGGRRPPIAARASCSVRSTSSRALSSCSAITAGSVPEARVGRVEPVGQRDQPLRDAVVDVAGQPPPLELLGLDDLLDEVLVRAFAGHQLAVQARLVHRTGDQLPDHQQQFDVADRRTRAGRRCAR